MRRRSNTAIPGEGFSKLHHQDFVSVAKQISCCKLKQLVLSPYQMAILRRGILQRADCDEVENANVLMGMEYSGAVGTMVIDELAKVNGWVSTTVDTIKAKNKELEWDLEDLDERLSAEKERVRELEERVSSLESEYHAWAREKNSCQAATSECVLQMAKLITEVRAMRLFQTALQHGPGNPIVVEDDKVVEDSEVEDDFNVEDVVFPNIGRFGQGEGLLMEIEDDPQDAARAVERAAEREELRARHLMMDDQAWREAMETEQLLWVDLVPGYILPPGFDVLGYPDPSSSD